MTTHPAIEELIRSRRVMTSIPAQPLSVEQSHTLRSALNIALQNARNDLKEMLIFETWVRGRGRHEAQIELTAEKYIQDLQDAIKSVNSLQVMIDNTKKNHVLIKADA